MPAPAMKPETALPQKGTKRMAARAPSRKAKPAAALMPSAARNSPTSRGPTGRPEVWTIKPTMRLCRARRTGRSARGMGWRPTTPQTALKDFRSCEAMKACARRAAVKRANSNWASRGSVAQRISGQVGSVIEKTAVVFSASGGFARMRSLRRGRKESVDAMAMIGLPEARALASTAAMAGVWSSESNTKRTRSGCAWARALWIWESGDSSRASRISRRLPVALEYSRQPWWDSPVEE